MVIWITRALALAIHERQLSEHGGGTGVRDDGLLDSALAKPQQFHAYGDPPPDLASLAASLTFGLSRNHPFVDGNKRTAAVACETFLILNGAALEATDLELYPVFTDLAAGGISEADFADWLRGRLRLRGGSALHEQPAVYRVGGKARR